MWHQLAKMSGQSCGSEVTNLMVNSNKRADVVLYNDDGCVRELLACASTSDWSDLKTHAVNSFDKPQMCQKQKSLRPRFYLLQ